MALDRFLIGAKEPAPFPDGLSSLAKLADVFPVDKDSGWRSGLNPWFQIIGMSANRALAYADEAHRPPFVPDVIWNWRMRLRLIPLLTTRALLENQLDRTEAVWSKSSAPPRRKHWPFALWLWAEGWVRPGAFPVVLSRELERHRAGGSPGRLPELFYFLERLPEESRKAAGASMIPEVEPWLAKVAEYGALGLTSLKIEAANRSGGIVSPDQIAVWDRSRRRLESGNGLELVVRLKLRLDAFVKWRRTPAARRPPEFKAEWPADPSDLL